VITDKKILAKIQKLFALSKSPNLNEAAIALKKAEALMDEYNLSYGEVSFIENYENLSGKKVYQWESKIFFAVCFANNCVGASEPGKGKLWLTGREINVFLSKEMLRYLVETVNRIAKEQCKGKGRKYNHDFKMAAAKTLAAKIYKYASGVSWAVDREKERKEIIKYNKDYVDKKESKSFVILDEAILAGSLAAENISLHKQAGIEETGQIGASV
jgi:hypothetical protein